MGRATPHGGVEPSVGPKTVVVGFPRVVVVCLLALAELARRKAAAVEGMNVDKVGKAEASKPPRALHADRPADASLESLHSLSKVVGTHKAPFALGRTGRAEGYPVPTCPCYKRHYPFERDQPPGKLDLVTVISILAYGMSPKIGLVLCTRIYCDWL